MDEFTSYVARQLVPGDPKTYFCFIKRKMQNKKEMKHFELPMSKLEF